jgi:hypothetical protein
VKDLKSVFLEEEAASWKSKSTHVWGFTKEDLTRKTLSQVPLLIFSYGPQLKEYR